MQLTLPLRMTHQPWLLYSPFTCGHRMLCGEQWRSHRLMATNPRAIADVHSDAWWCLSAAGLVWC